MKFWNAFRSITTYQAPDLCGSIKLDAETIIPNICYLNVSLFQKIVLYILHCYNVDKANVIFMDSLTEY